MTPEGFAFEPLGKQNRAAFSCGEKTLDGYFRERAGQDRRRNVASCFVLVDHANNAVLGYYTLSAGVVAATDLPESFATRLPRYPNLPGILLGRLAVDKSYQGQGFGRRLLVDALKRALDVSSQIGAVVVLVDALNEGAADFYASFGFTPFKDTPLRLFLPIAAIRDL